MSLQQNFGRLVTSVSVDGVERLGWVLVHSVWQLALLAFAAGLTVRALRRSSAATHYIVLVTAMGLSILIPVTTWVLLPASPSSQITEVDTREPVDFPIAAGSVVPTIRLRHGDSLIAPYAEEQGLESNLDAGTAELTVSDGALVSPRSGDEKPWLERLRVAARPWMTWIVAGWISGVLIFALRPLLGWRMLRRLRHTGAASVSEEVNGVLTSAACRLGLHRTAVGVLQSTLVQVPIVVGYLRPLILLPASLITSIPPTQLEAILAHELAHIVRHDFLVNLLQTLIETLFFYHPTIWWLSHRIRIEREHCCDDLVVSTWGNQVEYGRALLAVAELRRQSHVLALGATDGSLRSRVGRLFHVGTDRPNDRLMNRLPATLLSLVCLGVTIAALLAVHLPVDADDTSAITTEESASREIPISEVSAEGGADQRYVAEIPGGIKVEFVGITRNTAPARDGWRPDGLKMGEIPEWPEGLVMYGHNTTGRTKPENVPLDENGRDYLFEFQGLRRQPSFAFEMQTGGSYSHDPLQDPYRLRVSTRLRDESQFPQATFDPPADEVRVGLTDEPWGEWQQISVKGGFLNNVGASGRYPKSYSQIEILRVGPSERELHPNQTSLYLRQPNEARSLYAFEIRGIDDEGKNLWVTELQSQENKNNQSSDAEWGLALALPEGKRLARFEFRLRPYRHWVTFKGVSVESGTKSKVSVQLKSLPAEIPEQPQATAKTIVGTVVGQDHIPVAGIEVMVFESAKRLPQTFTTDDQGQFRVPQAWRTIRHYQTLVARDGDKRLAWFDFFMHAFSDDGQKTNDDSFQMVLLPLSRTVRGRLSDDAGHPIKQIPISVEQLQHEINFVSVHWQYQTLDNEPLIAGGITDNDGWFEVKVPADSSGILGAAHPNWRNKRFPFEQDKDVVPDTRLARATRIAGRVTDSRTGKPLADARVNAQCVHSVMSGGWGEAKTDANGEYLIGGLAVGEFNVYVTDAPEKQLIAPASVVTSSTPGEDISVDFALSEGRRVSGRVVNSKSDEPISEFRLTCFGPSCPGSGNLFASTNENGEFEFFVFPGKCQIAGGEGYPREPDLTRDVDVSAEVEPQPILFRVDPLAEEERPLGLKIFVGSPLERKVTVNVEKTPLVTVLENLCSATGLKLELDEDRLVEAGYSKVTPITLQLERIALKHALSQVLQPFDQLSFTVEGQTVFVSSRSRIKLRQKVNERRTSKLEEGDQKSNETVAAVSPETLNGNDSEVLSEEPGDEANGASSDNLKQVPVAVSTDVQKGNRNDQRRVSLAGRVNDASGNPVANALVLYPVRFDIKARKFRLARTTSNERGEFTLQVPKILFGDDPRKVHHVVWCWAEGHGIGTASIRSHGTEQSRPPILIKLPDTQPLEFVVLSEEKQPVRGAIVAPSMMRTPAAYYPIPEELKAMASRTSDEKGRVTLELVPKNMLDSVSVVTKSHGEQQFSQLSGNLQLLPVASVDGNIQGGLPGVRLLFCNYRNETRTEFETISDQQGRFTIPAFPTGVYTVRSDLPGPLMLATLDVLKPGHQTLTLQVDKGIPFKGRLVVRGTDRGVKNTLIRIQSGFNHQHDFDVTSNDRGEFQSYVLPGHQMRVQVYDFDPNEHFILPGFKAFEVPDGVTEFTPPDIEIDRATVWKGTLVDVNNVPLKDLYVEPKIEDKPTTTEKTDSQGRFEFWLRENVTPSGWRVTQTSEGSIVCEIDAETITENPLVIRIPRSRSQLEEDVLKKQKAGRERSNEPSKVPHGEQLKKTPHDTKDLGDPSQDDSRKQTWMKWHLDPRLDMPFSETMIEVPVHVALADIAEQLKVVLKINEPEIFADGGNAKTLSIGVTLEDWPKRLERLKDSPHEPDAVRLALLRGDGTINVREVLMLITEPILLDFLLVDDVLHVSTVEGIRSLRMANSVQNTAKATDPAK